MLLESSDDLEKLVHRIVELLEEEGAEVLLDERIPDPDNSQQKRQIDVAIRRDGKYTQVECRLHSRPQDVGWIECLIGRRISLGADAIIGVSASGFTAGARAKAAAHGVHLRDLRTLTDEEIRHWGEPVTIWMHAIAWNQLGLELQFSGNDVRRVAMKDVQSSEAITEILQRAVNLAVHHVAEIHHVGSRLERLVDLLMISGVTVSGVDVKAVRVLQTFRSIKEEVSVVSVLGYDAPEVPPDSAEAHVAGFGDGAFEVIRTSERQTLQVDLSPFAGIPNHFTYGWMLDSGKQIKTRIGRPLGLTFPSFAPGCIKLNIAEFK